VASAVAEETRVPDGALTATRDAPVGGQAVLEGVMMRGVSTWAVAVRKPLPEQIEEGRLDPEEAALGEIGVQSFPLVSIARRHRVLRWPLIRGVVALGESLGIGFKALGISANAQMPEEDQEISGGAWGATVALSIVLAIGLFFLLPVGITSLFRHSLPNSLVFVLVEKAIRITIFLGYLLLISRLKDLQRVFEYHGAEHKVISCYEAEDELTPERARLYSRLHPRCGTSFLLIVMIVSIFVFSPLGLLPWWALIVSRIVGVPLIAGISFELIKLAGKHRSKRWVQILMYPGLKLQLLTTREPDLTQLAVAIAAMQAVLERETPGELTDADLLGVEIAA
jgi:uncharacterized protein YqhQ